MDFKRTFAGMQIQRLLRWKIKKKKKTTLRVKLTGSTVADGGWATRFTQQLFTIC